jgi:hypothetical protein
MTKSHPLDEQLLNLVLEALDLAFELRALVRRHRACNHRARDSARAAQCLLRRHKHVGHVLVLAEEREVEEDFQGLCVGGHDDELRDAAIERLSRLVGTLLELLVVARLLHQLEDGDRQVGRGKRERLGVDFGLHMGRRRQPHRRPTPKTSVRLLTQPETRATHARRTCRHSPRRREPGAHAGTAPGVVSGAARSLLTFPQLGSWGCLTMI